MVQFSLLFLGAAAACQAAAAPKEAPKRFILEADIGCWPKFEDLRRYVLILPLKTSKKRKLMSSDPPDVVKCSENSDCTQGVTVTMKNKTTGKKKSGLSVVPVKLDVSKKPNLYLCAGEGFSISRDGGFILFKGKNGQASIRVSAPTVTNFNFETYVMEHSKFGVGEPTRQVAGRIAIKYWEASFESTSFVVQAFQERWSVVDLLMLKSSSYKKSLKYRLKYSNNWVLEFDEFGAKPDTAVCICMNSDKKAEAAEQSCPEGSTATAYIIPGNGVKLDKRHGKAVFSPDKSSWHLDFNFGVLDGEVSKESVLRAEKVDKPRSNWQRMKHYFRSFWNAILVRCW